MKSEEEGVILKYVTKLQQKILNPLIPEKKIIKYLGNLQSLPVTISILKSTGIGKTVNDLKKNEGSLGQVAQNLVKLWKNKFAPQKTKTYEADVRLKTEKSPKEEEKDAKLKCEENFRSRVGSSTPQRKDGWRDVSLNLLGFQGHSSKKKNKVLSKGTAKSSTNVTEKAATVLPEQKEKRHVIEVRRDPGMPSLPEIKLPEITLPEIQRTYVPLHFSPFDTEKESSQRKKALVSEKDLELSIVSRKSRTQVFSGRRSCFDGVVSSLYQQCMRILIENIDALEDTGGVPFEILEPLLAKASPAQLIRLEEFNPYFTEDSGELWKTHCQREFRGSQPEEMESWRELYLRKCAERVEKLKNIQSKISQSQAKKEPIRQAKLAYVAGPPKPSAQVRRKQLRYGTGERVDVDTDRPKKVKRELEERHKTEADHVIPFAKIPRKERCSSGPPKRNPRPDIFSKKPASRPMMQAALKMMKNQRSRSTNQIMRK